MNSGKKITLIDGNSLMFRSYYATAYRGELMKTKDGIFTNALYGFCNMLNSLLGEVEYAFVAFDAGKQTFRHQEYDAYKGTRKPLPDELRMQIPYIKKYLDLLRIPRFENLDYEADDLIASVANAMYDQVDEIRIITGDKDLLQLVNDKIKVCLTRKGIGELEEYNSENFFEKTQLTPSQIIDYKGLVGDTSDNLPGIKGIGEKTAIKLLSEYKTLEGIIAEAENIGGKTATLIKENSETGMMCKRLATLIRDINLAFSLADLKIGEYDIEALAAFYREMEFNSFLKKMNKAKSDHQEGNLEIISDDYADLELHGDACIIAEVFKENYYTGQFLGLSLVFSDHQYFFPVTSVIKNQGLKKYLEDERYSKSTFDYKKLYVVLRKHNLNIRNVSFDLMLAAYLLNPAYGSDDFKITADNFCTNSLPYYENVYGANTKMAIPSLETYAGYSVSKGMLLSKIQPQLKEEINKYEMQDLFRMEMELSPVLGKMEIDGLRIDLDRLNAIGEELSEKANGIAQEIYAIAGEEFNINSTKKLGEILFEKMHLPHGKKNKTGFSTNSDVLEKLAVDYPIAKMILEYRAYTKLVNTYVNGLKEVVDNDSFLHPLYKQALTQTGRLSSVEPNIQNMPIRTEEGQVIREAFISRFPGGKIMSADYSQIELRILAHLAADEKMIAAFNNDIDFHSQTAGVIYDLPLDKITKDMRRTAKAINFGIIYGMSAWGLSENLGITPLEANIYINKYFDTYARVKAFLDEIVAKAKTDGYTKTLFNRRRYIPEINSTNQNLRAFGERTAMNAPMQGSAADIIKIAMNRISRRLEAENMRALMIAQVHDELIFDTPLDEEEKLRELVKTEMENAVRLKIKLVVEVDSGDNWANAK
ncbi:MAG: DNA polymerase I [Acholeplasmataceae bacterium]|nr:DNA polymerase I [Acholeplasmataceae bacterium]